VSELRFRRLGRIFNGTQVLFTLGYLLTIVVFWHGEAPDQFSIDSDRIPSDSLERIWPVAVGLSEWPRKRVFSYMDLSSLAKK
jgi:hypothetical protein